METNHHLAPIDTITAVNARAVRLAGFARHLEIERKLARQSGLEVD